MDKRVTICDACGDHITGDGPHSGVKVLPTGDHLPDPVERPDETAEIVRLLASDRADSGGQKLPPRVDVCSACIQASGGLARAVTDALRSQLTERGRVQMGEEG